MRQDEKLTSYEGACLFAIAFLTFLFNDALPHMLQIIGPSAWIPQIASIVLAIVFLGVFLMLYFQYKEMSLLVILDTVYGRALSRIIMTLILGYLFLDAATGLNQCVETIQGYAYSKMNALQIDILVMAAVSVISIYSVKGIAKTISIFLPFILLAVLLILYFSKDQYDIDLLNPILGTDAEMLGLRSVSLTSKFNSIFLFSIIGNAYGDKKQYRKNAIAGILISGILLVFTTLCFCMTIPYSSVADIRIGMVGLAQGAWNGRFMPRVESSYIAISVIANIVLIGCSFLLLKKVYCHLFSISKQHSGAVIVPLAALVLCIARMMGNNVHFKTMMRHFIRRYSIFLFLGIIMVTLIVSFLRKHGGKRAIRYSALMLVPCLLTGLFSGCSNYTEPDSVIFPLSIGYDKGERELYRITLKFMTIAGSPEEQDAKNNGETGKEETPGDIMVFESPSVAEGIHLVNALLPQEVSMLHIQLIVISEEIAQEGVDGIVDPLINTNQLKPTMPIVISKCSAYELLASKNPTLTASVQTDIELIPEIAQQNTSYLSTNLSQFLYFYKSNYGDAMAIYGNINQSGYDFPDENDETQLSPADKIAFAPADFSDGYVAGETPVIGNRELELAGMAVFHGDKMTGTLTTRETQVLALLDGSVKETLVLFPDLLQPDKYNVTLKLKRVQPVETNALIGEDGKALIKIAVSYNGDIGLAQNPDSDYSDNPDQREDLAAYCSKVMCRRSDELIQKLQKELHSDVLQIGRRVARNFLTTEEWEDYNWLEEFPEAEISVSFKIYL